MLVGLNISNIVLIEKLNLEFGTGLNILTGETGAGKSILLDALSLALGARSDVGLIRHGCEIASVVAEFDSCDVYTNELLDENGIDCDGSIILRRTLTVDGKSRAWVNDTPVSIKTLKQIGDHLVEIHGQFANHTLLNPSTHRVTLDEYASANIDGFSSLLDATRRAYNAYNSAQKQLHDLEDMVARNALERDFLAHNVAELKSLNPQLGEEEELASKRASMMNAEKNTAILAEASEAISPRGNSLESQIFSVAHILQRIRGDENPYSEQIDKLYAAAEIVADVANSLTPQYNDAEDLESIEERLFAIRAAARKHRVAPDDLVKKLNEMSEQLNIIDNSDATLKKIKSQVVALRAHFNEVASKLTAARGDASEMLRKKILSELPELKLGSADVLIQCDACAPSANGCDDVLFMIKTNPGAPFAPLHKSASGGELARLMLALRVVLADANTLSHTFVFDEVDTGISGATASAVGARLKRLATSSQALVITHSAQVAGFADRHFKIVKTVNDNTTTTSVHEILSEERINEIARIISGDEITSESITMAKTLIKG